MRHRFERRPRPDSPRFRSRSLRASRLRPFARGRAGTAMVRPHPSARRTNLLQPLPCKVRFLPSKVNVSEAVLGSRGRRRHGDRVVVRYRVSDSFAVAKSGGAIRIARSAWRAASPGCSSNGALLRIWQFEAKLRDRRVRGQTDRGTRLRRAERESRWSRTILQLLRRMRQKCCFASIQ